MSEGIPTITTTAAASTKYNQSILCDARHEKNAAYKAKKARFAGSDARAKRQKLFRTGERELEKTVRDSEAKKQGKKPEDVKLKNLKKSWSK